MSPTASRSSIVSRIAHESYVHAPSIMPTAPWWDHLESNFCKRPEGFELEPVDQMRVRSTAALDVAIRLAGASMVGALALPAGYHPLKIREMFRDRAMYEAVADSGEARRFFVEPPRGVRIRTRKPLLPFFRPDEGVCEDLRFESPYEPFNPRIRKDYLKHRGNRIAHARYWRHKKGPRPTIAAFHGFSADPYWLNGWFFALPWLYKMGCDVLLFTIPFHGPRQSRFSLFSGHGLFSGGITRLNEAFAQTVHDFRIIMNHLEDRRGVEKIGVTGVSLGGYVVALLAAVEKRIAFSIPNVPVVSIADLMLEWFPISAVVRSLLLVLGKSIKDLRHMMAVHCPLTYKPVIPKDRLMIIGGAGDRLAPPKHSRLLWDHWGRCRIHWFPGSHLLHLDKGAYLQEMAKFLGEIGFVDGEHREY